MAQYAYRIEHNYGTGNEERWGLYLDGVGVESHKGPIQEYARTALDNHLDELDEDTAYGQWRVLVYNTKHNVHGENRIDIADPDDADAIVEADLDEGTRDLYVRFEIMASSGAEIQEGRPTWGVLDGEGAFLDQVTYEEGDGVADAVARFQRAGKLPRGEFTFKRVRVGEYWAHEEHPWCYFVTIDID